MQEEGKECFKHRNYKLVILDNEMPMKSGIQVALQIREGQRLQIISKDIKLALSSGESSSQLSKLILKV
jgi:CheY-like chemotaxis protein